MQKKLIAVSGKNGQLGRELQDIAAVFSDFDFVFAGKEELDLATDASIEAFFEQYKPAFFINCGAYTAVDKAEQEQEVAYRINAEAVGTIAKCCEKYGTALVHISTDYVFNGNATSPYEPDDDTEPVNYYGYTKWVGEKLAMENCSRCIVIRTSWVYSEYGNNFVKTMMRLMKERSELNVVSDQVGSPTYAKDLAEVILQIITQEDKIRKGVYHFSNEGVISWYEFAVAIRDEIKADCTINAIATSQYPTPAKRPHYSAMSKKKIASDFGVSIHHWRYSLKACLQKLH